MTTYPSGVSGPLPLPISDAAAWGTQLDLAMADQPLGQSAPCLNPECSGPVDYVPSGTIPAARGGLPASRSRVGAGRTIPAARGGHCLTCTNVTGQAAPRSVWIWGWPADSSTGVAGTALWRSWPSDVDAAAVDESAASARSAFRDSHFP